MIFDLHGTGDSSGEFGDASWEGWLTDVRKARDWLRQRVGSEPILWGLRVGCLLISEVLDDLPTQELIYWQPVIAGEVAVTQFLRLRTMGISEDTGARKETTRTLLDALERGEALEIAGYDLPPAIALPLRLARLRADAHAGKRVSWLEVALTDPPACSPAGSARIAELRSHGAKVAEKAVAGVPFWTTVEIDEAPGLVAATASMVSLAK